MSNGSKCYYMTSMYDPAHPGEIIRDAIEEKDWTLAESANRLGVPRKPLLHVLNGEAGVSLQLALALERLGWSDAGHWVRMQGAYDLAQFRRTESAA